MPATLLNIKEGLTDIIRIAQGLLETVHVLEGAKSDQIEDGESQLQPNALTDHENHSESYMTPRAVRDLLDSNRTKVSIVTPGPMKKGRWTSDESSLCNELLCQGLEPTAISSRLGRTSQQIRDHIRRSK